MNAVSQLLHRPIFLFNPKFNLFKDGENAFQGSYF